MDKKTIKKGKKEFWIKIVAAVVIVGALATVGVLGMQGDWFQGKVNLKMLTKEQAKTITAPKISTKKVTPQAVKPSVCGNSMVESGETCDDGNKILGDGCSACTVEIGWACPKGIICNPVCGDNILVKGETCDDGNIVDGDGCSSTCQIEESGFIKIDPAAAPSMENFVNGYYPLFNLTFQNTSNNNLRLASFRVDFGSGWQVPTTSGSIQIFDAAQQYIGDLIPTEDGGLFSNDTSLFALATGESKTVTVVWKENIYPKRLIQKTQFTLQIPTKGITSVNPSTFELFEEPSDGPLSISLSANLPQNLRLGYLQGFLDNAITSNQEIEKITFVVNQQLADLYPDWQTNAENLVNAYNQILAVNTHKQLEIGRFMILGSLSDQCPDQIAFHPEYYLSNGSYGGLTIFYTFIDENTIMPSCNLGFMTAGEQVVNGQNFGVVNMNDGPDPNNPTETYPRIILAALIHEVGHALGLGYPEWYMYLHGGYPVEDITGVSPTLPPYIPSFLNGNIDDPMFSGQEFPYSELNAFIINHNGNHKFSGSSITNLFTPRDIKLKVMDASGNPVNNADVKIFGMRTNALQETYEHSNSQPLLQTLSTNSQGEAMLPLTALNFIHNSTDPGMDYTVKAVKVSKDGKYAGANYSTLDLQYALLMEGKDVYEITLRLK